MKYELTNESIEFNNRTLYRICALKDFSNVSKGELGGYVESLDNLSQNGNSWIYHNAKVYDKAYVFDYAKVSGNANISDNAEVSGNAYVSGNAQVYGNAKVYDNAYVFDDAWIYGNAEVSKTPLILTGLKYKIQFFDNLIGVGCLLKTKEEWLTLTKKEINELDGKQTDDLINQIKKTIELYG